MVRVNTPVLAGDDIVANENQQSKEVKTSAVEVGVASSGASAEDGIRTRQSSLVPLRMKLISILLVTAVGFGSHWSSGVTGAMKSTLKKVSHHSATYSKAQD
jgi:hypothetical protein